MSALQFPNISEKNDSKIYRAKVSFSAPSNTITTERAKELLKFINPVTLPYTDTQGRTIQLWKLSSELVASVSSKQGIVILSGKYIINPLQPSEESSQLLKRLESVSPKNWHFSYTENTKKIVIWPHMVAAGKDGPSSWTPPTFSKRENVP